jgi:hypothetical protein
MFGTADDDFWRSMRSAGEGSSLLLYWCPLYRRLLYQPLLSHLHLPPINTKERTPQVLLTERNRMSRRPLNLSNRRVFQHYTQLTVYRIPIRNAPGLANVLRIDELIIGRHIVPKSLITPLFLGEVPRRVHQDLHNLGIRHLG